MNAFNEQIKAARVWWDGRTAREHVMLGVLGGVLALVLAWFLILAPLLAWKDGAADRLHAAVQTHALASAAAGIDTSGGVPRTPADLETLLTDSAAEVGVAVQVSQDGADTTFTVESAETARLFGWIAALERSGLSIASLSVLENADATLQAQGTVAP
ncbi:MAG: type II secretion system protein GspM [Brevundimonas sp.]|uniref:type II secretion system protein GspM n=1 Tax=Brevundimonas sp. TaxID=1871086 RepID=UPI003918D0C2